MKIFHLKWLHCFSKSVSVTVCCWQKLAIPVSSSISTRTGMIHILRPEAVTRSKEHLKPSVSLNTEISCVGMLLFYGHVNTYIWSFFHLRMQTVINTQSPRILLWILSFESDNYVQLVSRSQILLSFKPASLKLPSPSLKKKIKII